jgi:hypothetical protein
VEAGDPNIMRSGKMTDRELLEFVAAQVGNLTVKVDGMDKRMDSMDKRIGSMEKTLVVIEHEHGQKLEALFDGYKQNTEMLYRIENKISKHEEIILQRVK